MSEIPKKDTNNHLNTKKWADLQVEVQKNTKSLRNTENEVNPDLGVPNMMIIMNENIQGRLIQLFTRKNPD